MSFTVYPAIDVRDGRVVRLRQGDYARETDYGADPFTLARSYAGDGAQWLHLVDLDAARAGGYGLAPLLSRLTSETALRIQTGGGLREEADIERLLRAGAARVVIGSVAVQAPERVSEWIQRYGSECITLALDTRQDEHGRWRLPVHGWVTDSGRDLDDLLQHYAQRGLRHLLCTDISRDGMMSGPNLALYRHVHQAAPGVQLQASGGMRSVADVRAAQTAGCAGVVLGRALLEQRLELPQALAC